MEFTIAKPTDDQVIGALDTLDTKFVSGGVSDSISAILTPETILEALARSADSRVRSAIIPFLLRHPEFADAAVISAQRLEMVSDAHATLTCFYAAARLLQLKYRQRLTSLFDNQPALPDYFSEELDLQRSDNVEVCLEELGARNAALRGLALNWVGTYEHAARTWLDYVEWQKQRENVTWRVN